MKARLHVLIGVIGALTLAPTAPAAAKPRKPPCERTAEKVAKQKRVSAGWLAGQLESLVKKDADCTAAPAEALKLVEREWDRLQPVAVRAVPRGVVLRELGRYQVHLRALLAIAAFRKSPVRAQTYVRAGRLTEAMATYLDEVGTGPDTVFLIKDKEALYHSRAVDLRERLKIDAEELYGTAIKLLKDASSKNETLAEARERLAALKERYAARTPPPPPPPAGDNPEIAPAPRIEPPTD